MSERIFWSEEEQDTLFSAAKSIWEQPGGKDKSAIELVRLAQIALPEGRRRSSLIAVANIPVYLRDKLIRNEIGKLKYEQPPRELTKDELRIEQLGNERDELLERVKNQQSVLEQMREEIRTLKARPEPPSEIEVLASFFSRIAVDVAIKVKNQGELQKALSKETGEQPPAPKHNPNPVQEVKEHNRPIIVIFDPHPQEGGHDKWVNSFPLLNLRFEEPREDGRVFIPACDEAIMIAGVRHATSAAVREKYPGARLVARVNMPQMLDSINKRWHHQ